MVLISVHEMLTTRNVSRDSHRISNFVSYDEAGFVSNFSQFKFCIT